jgi:hypothetical protein
MEIIHLTNNTYQVVNVSNSLVLFQGVYEECLAYEENILWNSIFDRGTDY